MTTSSPGKTGRGEGGDPPLVGKKVDRSLRIVFLDSWLPASHEGSGTAVGIRTLEEGLRALGHTVETLRPEKGAGTLLGRLRFNLALPHLLAGEREPDLVVGFDVDGVFWGRSPERRTPYVLALKGIAADEARFSRSFGERLLLSTLARWEKTNAESADLILVPSRYSAEVARREYGCAEERLRVVPEPIDLTPWPAEDVEEMEASRPTILSVARQYPRKDTGTLLRALSLLRNRFPDVHLRVIGGGPELPALRSLSESLGLGDAVTFHGSVPDDSEVRKAYMEADVFALPSLQEGFGIVFLEAMAAALPVVAARAGAAPEVLGEEAAILVPPSDPCALASALDRLLGDPGERKRRGAAGRRRVTRFGSDAVALAFLDEVAPILKVAP